MVQLLSNDVFRTVVASTPLVSIDLIVSNPEGKILLGYRNNRPAKDLWFVPGGRICKGESFDIAFNRLTQLELGKATSIDSASFIGVYEHFYEDNFSGTDFTTHYVVLGYRLELDIVLNLLPIEQHNHFRWWSIEELLSSDVVHDNTKAYFRNID